MIKLYNIWAKASQSKQTTKIKKPGKKISQRQSPINLGKNNKSKDKIRKWSGVIEENSSNENY